MRTRPSLVVAGLGFGAVLVAASTVGVARLGTRADPNSLPGVAAAAALATPPVNPPGPTLDDTIARLKARVADIPADHIAWADLGAAYVQQARVTGDVDLYDRAAEALDTSLGLEAEDNFTALAGHAALSAAGHDFVAAREYALDGLEINPYSAVLWGALSDAELQLGRYEEAGVAVQRMLDLSPDTSSLARASYLRELRGDIAGATELMQRALEMAPTRADRAFALLHLGHLAFNAGAPAAALEQYDAALEEQPDGSAAQAGQARALAALGRTEEAIGTYETLLAGSVEPAHALHYAELLDSVGRADAAATYYDLYARNEAIHAANEFLPDGTYTLFLADHGQEELALTQAQRAVDVAPFVETLDAYAWALHRNGRDDEAREAIDAALILGTPSALFHYHAGMIRFALGDDEEAEQHLARALELNPHFNAVAARVTADTLAELHAN